MLKCPEKGGARLCGAPPPRRIGAWPRRIGSLPCSVGSAPCRVGPPTRRGSSSKGPKLPKRGRKERATSYWDPAMSRWASNTTWLRLQGAKTAQKGARRACHVVLGLRHVVLGLQREVSPAQRHQIPQKASQKSAPRRIGPPPCRVGLPTRRGSSPKSPKQPKREQKERVTSYWPPRHVALGLQHDVAPAQRRQNSPKGIKKSAPRRIRPPPCRVGPLTRRGSPTSDSIVL